MVAFRRLVPGAGAGVVRVQCAYVNEDADECDWTDSYRLGGPNEA